jgi:hypothetical protein
MSPAFASSTSSRSTLPVGRPTNSTLVVVWSAYDDSLFGARAADLAPVLGAGGWCGRSLFEHCSDWQTEARHNIASIQRMVSLGTQQRRLARRRAA